MGEPHDKTNSMFLFLDSNTDFVGADQTSWAADQLLQANGDKTIRHIFVIVHHGPFSSGPHGPNHRLLDSGLIDRFVASGVDIIFSGHDHIYDRGEHKELRYVVTAGGGAPLYPTVQRQPYSRVALSEYHYVRDATHSPTPAAVDMPLCSDRSGESPRPPFR